MVFEMYKTHGIDAGLIDFKDVLLEAFSGESINQQPHPIQNFADRILKADGVHFVTPEYNGGVPGVLNSSSIYFRFLKFLKTDAL